VVGGRRRRMAVGVGGEEEVRTLKKYKRILKYVRDTNGQRRSNHLEERVRAI
jgi:tartrate dehydratase alpha subunit/fumarate hydratase class I-like protein